MRARSSRLRTGLYSFKLFQQARATGADLLWRVKANLVRPDAETHLPDGSYLAGIYDSPTEPAATANSCAPSTTISIR